MPAERQPRSVPVLVVLLPRNRRRAVDCVDDAAVADCAAAAAAVGVDVAVGIEVDVVGADDGAVDVVALADGFGVVALNKKYLSSNL